MQNARLAVSSVSVDGGWLDIVQADGPAVVRIGVPRVRLLTDSPALHIPSWKMFPGGIVSDDADAEFGYRAGYFRADLDDSSWYGAARVSDVSFGFPTWEGDSFQGYLWYRAPIDSPGGAEGEPITILLGCAAEIRHIEWRVYLDGEQIGSRASGGVLELTLQPGTAAHSLLATPGLHQLAVQLRVTNPLDTADRRRESEGWRRVDPFCWQYVSWGQAWNTTDTWTVQASSDLSGRLQAKSLSVEYRCVRDGNEFSLHTWLRNESPAPVVVSEVGLAAVRWPQRDIHLSREGAIAYTDDGWFAAAAHPGQLTLLDAGSAVPTVWVGLTLAAGASVQLPTVVIAGESGGSGRSTFRDYLRRHGQRGRTHLSVYDPYGWYQISHASEPKIELTDELAVDIEATLSLAETHGVAFDFLSLDCGWNDPDDYRFFHPVNMPSDGTVIRDVAKARDVKLMLWASPSDGPRAFRHELGLQTPGFEDCRSGNPVLPWRLCPAAPRWRDAFREALLSHVRDSDVRGFKIDGTDVWCNGAHDHLPGIWSVYATAEALRDTFEQLRAAGAELIMMYWGLRSPWWLLWGDTLYERGYLVEAAAPSGTRSWGLRPSVASSQDIGHQASWSELPATMQDSLGVWISDTAWASWQGEIDWADAIVMDIGRGSRLTQLWGNLNLLMDDSAEATQFGELIALERDLDEVLNGVGTPILSAAWEDGPYGYQWYANGRSAIFVSNPGCMSQTYQLDVVGARSVEIRYCTQPFSPTVDLEDGDRVRVTQPAGTVVVIEASAKAGATWAGARGNEALVRNWDRKSSSHSPLPSDRAEEIAKHCYLGRGPQIQPLWVTGESYHDESAEAMAIRLGQPDRALHQIVEEWTGEIVVTDDGELAVVVGFTQAGAAWHNDRLHELCKLDVSIDSVPSHGVVEPHRAHEQAGSWTWSISRHQVTSGEHHVALTLRAWIPVSVTTDAQLWVRALPAANL